MFLSFIFQVFELCFSDDEEASAVRRCAQTADWTTSKKFRRNENLCPSHARRKTDT
jgi:hypothetical protein